MPIRGGNMDPDEIRRRGIRKVVIGVGMLVILVVAMFVLAPLYLH
jgi:hypothetical protein